MKIAGLLFLMGAVVAGPLVLAQDDPLLEPFYPSDGKPVMRAVPVKRDANGAEIPPPPVAAPLATPMPVATPIRVATPIPFVRPGSPTTPATPKATPVAPKATPAQTLELPDPTGEIRITPQGAMRQDQVQLSIADGFYVRKAYDQAASEYERYLELYPNTADRASVLYRLAESYRIVGAANASKSYYELILIEFPNGDLVGASSYRLAEIAYQDRNFAPALIHYRRASVRLTDARLVNSSKFFAARCMEALGQKLEARLAYEELALKPTNNPFYDASRLSLALLLKAAGRTTEALKQIQSLAKDTANEELRAQANVYSGLWQIDLDQTVRAAEDLKKAIEMPGIGRFKDVAQLGLMQLQFKEKKFTSVVETFKTVEFGPEYRPQALQLSALSLRNLGKSKEAVALFDELIKTFPTSSEAAEAAVERLTCFYYDNDPHLIEEIDAFVAANPESPKRDQLLLMKAETLFKRQDFAGAAALYSPLSDSRHLNGSLKGEALSKLGWCLMQTKDYERAIKNYTAFISLYPASKGLASALCQRGVAKLRLKDLAGALRDFDELCSKFPKARERELALQQKALIQGQMNENVAMAETFRLLLKDYPETPAAAEANYWIGWVAFENKDYKAAPGPLENARKLDKAQYFEKASLRVMLSYFYLENREAVARELEIYKSGGAKQPVPYEVIHWLGQSYFEAALAAGKPEARKENLANATKYLTTVTAREDARPDDFLNLGRSQLELKAYEAALGALEKYLRVSKEPRPRSIALLAMGQAHMGLGALDAAQKSVDGVIELQPDGDMNAVARILAGDIQKARGNFEAAAKVYESVGVLIDDENITPRALESAVEAYKSAGREADAKRLQNTLQSRYPEYFQRKRST